MTRDARHNSEAGFSLIEALVALAILAIATVGLVRSVEAHIDSTRAMEQRAVAMWVAENHLAELEAGVVPAREVAMLGQRWRIAVDERGTDDPEIAALTIRVFASDGGPSASPLASLDAFLDAGGQ
ncbi:type II secretion system minor pseudopilin GspI [Sphingomonas baiyangensis]|uniref:Type II secretion system protein I n=1 Tax=Sphingomonas baiyangensis TaxID=2572576 RepID=A0A4V5PV92_9SPHN|nr:type II secretion system minor pseudopilin GspI [Sphingomonas baiyangensis]TKD53118.1 type II secretion system protein GspI [Sphingomonas baiyangensis]